MNYFFSPSSVALNSIIHRKDHYHVRCVSCGKVFDMDMPYITGLEKTANDLHGFALLGHDIIFKGICPKCIAKNKINTGGQK